jgi:hypothetical protein
MKSQTPPVINHSNFPEYLGQIIARLDTLEEMLTKQAPAASSAKPVTTKELCAFLGITEPTAIRWRKKKAIPYYTIGSAVRYDLPKVIASLENNKRK